MFPLDEMVEPENEIANEKNAEEEKKIPPMTVVIDIEQDDVDGIRNEEGDDENEKSDEWSRGRGR